MLDFTAAFELSSRADVVFSVNGEDIYAHSFILYFRSPVFKTMFDGPMAPKSENGEKPVIKINDERVSAENFRVFLKYLYSDQVEVTGDNAFSLLNLAKMYDVASLFKLCEEFLTKNLNSDNVVTIANSASIFHDSKVFKTAVEFIVTKSDVLFKEEKYCEMNQEVFLAVLKQEKISTMKAPNCFVNHPTDTTSRGYCYLCGKFNSRASEIDIFKIMLKWGTNQCKIKNLEENPKNMKEILEPFLPWIRFPAMKIDELATVVYPTEILDGAVMAAVFVDANSLSKNETTNKSTFSKDRRCFCFNQEFIN